MENIIVDGKKLEEGDRVLVTLHDKEYDCTVMKGCTQFYHGYNRAMPSNPNNREQYVPDWDGFTISLKEAEKIELVEDIDLRNYDLDF